MYEKIIVVTRKTRLQELVEKFNTKKQARFYIEHSGGDFSDYIKEDDSYRKSIEVIQAQLANTSLRIQYVDRSFLPSFVFSAKDLVVALGQDGLVANAAKYVGTQPIIGVNPDPARFDGILVPWSSNHVRGQVESVLAARAQMKYVTLAEAILNDGQRLLAFNDLFVGARTHVSARYKLEYEGHSEVQSSSGLIISTRAGATGWLSSIFNMVKSVAAFSGCEEVGYDEYTGRRINDASRINLDKPQINILAPHLSSEELCFVVREPFLSKHSSANIVIGKLSSSEELVIESRMPAGGTIFSDGIENDFLKFDSGTIARVRTAPQRVGLVVPTSAHEKARGVQMSLSQCTG